MNIYINNSYGMLSQSFHLETFSQPRVTEGGWELGRNRNVYSDSFILANVVNVMSCMAVLDEAVMLKSRVWQHRSELEESQVAIRTNLTSVADSISLHRLTQL